MKKIFLLALLVLSLSFRADAQTEFRHISFDEAKTAAKAEGKFIFIDFFTTWCGPCKAAIAENEPLKLTTLSDPDIVWVYVADESSPIPAYYKMIPTIKGHHYRLTEAQARALYERYNIDGIPYYFIADRKGNVTPRPDFRDHDLMVTTILEELKK